MGACEPGQGRKSAAISGNLQVRWTSRRGAWQREDSGIQGLGIRIGLEPNFALNP